MEDLRNETDSLGEVNVPAEKLWGANSTFAGAHNPRWGRRAAAVLAMPAGAVAGTLVLAYSVAVPLLVCGVMTAICALARLHLSRKEPING